MAAKIGWKKLLPHSTPFIHEKLAEIGNCIWLSTAYAEGQKGMIQYDPKSNITKILVFWFGICWYFCELWVVLDFASASASGALAPWHLASRINPYTISQSHNKCSQITISVEPIFSDIGFCVANKPNMDCWYLGDIWVVVCYIFSSRWVGIDIFCLILRSKDFY